MKIQIHHNGIKTNSNIDELINKKVDKLSRINERIIHADVYLKEDDGTDYEHRKVVEVKVAQPGPELFASASAGSFEEATDKAVEAVKRQISKRKGKLNIG